MWPMRLLKMRQPTMSPTEMARSWGPTPFSRRITFQARAGAIQCGGSAQLAHKVAA